MEVDIAGKLFPNITTMIVQLMSTGVLLFFFKKFLYGPLQNYLAKRAEFIENNLSEARDMNEQARLHMEESEKLAREGAREYRETLEKAKADAQLQGDEMIAAAKAEAASRLEMAERQIASERQAAKDQMHDEIVEVAMAAAGKIVEKEIDENTHRGLVEDFVSEVSR